MSIGMATIELLGIFLKPILLPLLLFLLFLSCFVFFFVINLCFWVSRDKNSYRK